MLVLTEIPKVAQCWKLVRGQSCPDFVDYFGANYPEVSLGCTFAPEACESLEHAWFCLKWCVEELGLRQIRFGLRWEKIEEQEGLIDLSYYQPFLEYLVAHKVKITLAVGPIKAPRWPEEYIPKWVWQQTARPKTYSKTQVESILAKLALNYLERLLPELYLIFPDTENLVAIQVENEPFNPFGWLKIRTSQDYLQRAISLVHQHFPQLPILLNSAGRLNLRAIIKQIQCWPNLKFIVGLDYYYTHDFWVRFGTSQFLDPVGVSTLWDMSIRRLQKLSQIHQFDLEVTEVQMEPWGRAREPGNSADSLKYVLLRCSQNVLGGHGLIRLWGVEYLSLQFFKKIETEQHRQMAQIINQIQSKN